MFNFVRAKSNEQKQKLVETDFGVPPLSTSAGKTPPQLDYIRKIQTVGFCGNSKFSHLGSD